MLTGVSLRANYGKHAVATIATSSGVENTSVGVAHIPMAAWQTQGLAVGIVCVCTCLVMTLAHRWRKQHAAARREETQRIRRYERESIARSLHDTYLQSVQGLMLSTDAAVKKLPTDGDVRNDFEALLLRMSRVLAEGRDQLSLLRCAFISSHQFRESLLRDLEVMVPGAGARVECHGLDAIDQLCRHLQHDLYAIAREAVTNALKHTSGMVAVQASTSAAAFVLSIVDEGSGFGEFVVGRPGHYGMQGMRERSRLLGAELEFSDVIGRGARVTLTLCATLAYRGPDRVARSRPGFDVPIPDYAGSRPDAW
jgi:signal transduction histidine kinase